MPTADYEVRVYNPDGGELLALIQQIEWQSMRYTRAVNDVGTFQITIPLSSSKASSLLMLDALIEVIRRPNNSTYTVEGTYFARTFNPLVDESDLSWLVVGGEHVNQILRRRVIDPDDDPLNGGKEEKGPGTGAGYSTKSGTADDVMSELVEEQAGPTASADRQVPGLTVAPSASVGNNVGGRWTYQDNLLETLQSLALTSGMDFEVEREEDADLLFTAHIIGSDKTYTTNHPTGKYVVFAPELGNMSQPAITRDRRNEINYLYLLLRGPEEARETFEQSLPTVNDSPFNRIEGSSDARELEEDASITEFQTQGFTFLRENASEEEFSFNVTNAASTYHDIWDIGDSITARWPDFDNYQQDLRIIGVEVEVMSSGETVTPVFRPVIQRSIRREGAAPSRGPVGKTVADAFKNTRREVRQLKADLRALTGKSQRSEVGGSTPRWDSVDDLPTAGTLGRWASVTDDVGGGAGDEGLFWDDGSAWVQIV